MTDPVLRGRLAHLRRHAIPPGIGFTRNIDAVLISHLHYDHLDLPSLRRFDRDLRVIVPAGGGRLIRREGFTDVVELRVGESATVRAAVATDHRTAPGSGSDRPQSGQAGQGVPQVEVRAVPALHQGRRRPFGTRAEAVGFEITGSRRLYFAGDTDIFPELSELAGGLEVALLPVWGWGLGVGPGHMDPAAAAEAAMLLEARISVPIHWGTFFPLGLRRWRGNLLAEPPLEFQRLLAERAPELAVRVLSPGESLKRP